MLLPPSGFCILLFVLLLTAECRLLTAGLSPPPSELRPQYSSPYPNKKAAEAQAAVMLFERAARYILT
jgi:hypothetical protein